ncbi:MAG: peptidase D-alanyl-D-alanine carboxypeptidase 1 [Lacrimispora sp.]|nr:peptidase D-alanyl-D-alanine carboxypeptidase 1 [Lacrimispora sp.]
MRHAKGILLAAAGIAIFSFIGIFAGKLAEKEAIKNHTSVTSEKVDHKTPVQTTDELNLYAQSAVLMDASTNRILYGKNQELVRPMASTTKIMTCIIALENGNLSDPVTATQNAANQPKVHLGVYKGETIYLKDLLYSLMLESHNDAAMMIAEHVGGSREGFAKLMNQKAKELGCSNTYFITPNGLDAKEESDGEIKEHATTAADLARIMDYCIGSSPKSSEFLEITGTQNYYFTDVNGKRSFSCTNHNALLNSMSGALSGKTGFTGGAGYSYVGAVKSDGRIFTIALLGCGWPPHKTYKWSDARKLFQYGMDRYHYRDVYEEVQLPKVLIEEGIPVSGGLDQPVLIACAMAEDREKSIKLLLADDEKVTVKTSIPNELEAPVKKGQKVGAVTYWLSGKSVKEFPVYLTDGSKRLTVFWCLKNILSRYLSMPGFPQILTSA